MKRIAAFACSLACIFSAAAVRAQPLADRVPDDALLYVGWAGASTLADAYGPSNLKAVLDESRIRDLFGKYLDDVEAKVVKQSPDAREAFRAARALATPLWKYPTAFFVGRPDLSDMQHPVFRVGLLCKAGAHAQAMAEEINAQLARAPKPPENVKAAVVDDLVCLAVGYDEPYVALAGGGSQVHPITANPAFAEALKQTIARPVTITYVSIEGVLQVAEGAAESNNPEAKQKFSAFLDASGLRDVKAYVDASGFDGKDWVGQTFVGAPSPRTGLLTAMPNGPGDASLLQTIPADSTFFATARFDAATFVRQTQAALAKTDPELGKYFNMGLSGVQQAVGTNVLDNLLEPLGNDWALYTAPRVGASGILGMVAVNKLDDPAKMLKALRTASVNLTNWINIGVSKAGPNNGAISVHGATTKIGDVDVYYIAAPIVAPSWAISNGRLYIGLYPQVVGAAARQAGKGGPSIVDGEKYKALVKRLGAPEVGAATFYDLPTSAGTGGLYPQLLALVRYAGIGDLFGVTLPEPLLPPMDVLMDHLAPAGSVSWSDAAGFHTKSVAPFPGAKALTEQGAISSIGVGSGALTASILLPSLNRARETANRVKSASNLRQIGTGIALYANENRGKYPADFGELLKTEDLVPEVFVNPRTDTQLPADARKVGDAAFTFVREEGDYVYIGMGLNNSAPAEAVVAYEKPERVQDGINILFGDGHVDFMMMTDALPLIEGQKKDRGIQ